MSETRPPRPLRRQVLLEAGYRCSVPGCAYPDVELHHIIPEEEGGNTDYDNLIALCPNHHRDAHIAGRIDRKALRITKANQVLLNARYSDLERRLLLYLAEGQADVERNRKDWTEGVEGNARPVHLVWHPMNFEFGMLIRDGLIEEVPMRRKSQIGAAMYGLTERGVEFVKRWVAFDALDPEEIGDE